MASRRRTWRASTRASRRLTAGEFVARRARARAAGALGARRRGFSFRPRPRRATSRCCAARARASASKRCARSPSTASARRARAVRAALAGGDSRHAAALLGRNYAITGRVAHGDKLGRNLGFPTANVPLRRAPALTGIFAVRVHGLAGAPRAGVASVGVRPTVKVDGEAAAGGLHARLRANRSTAGASRWSSCTSCVTRSGFPTSTR